MPRNFLLIATIVCASLLGAVSGCPGADRNVCANDEACGPFAVCVAGTCAQPCAEHSDCPAAKFCDGQACNVGCRDDSGCVDGERCLDNTCNAGCASAVDCSDGFVCREETCVEGCANDGDCGPGAFCQAGACRPFGATDAGVPACERDLDCRVGEICEGGQCRVGRRSDAGPSTDTGGPTPVDAGQVPDWVINCYAGAAEGEGHNRGLARGETPLVATSNREGAVYTWRVTENAGGVGVSIQDNGQANALLISRRVGNYAVSVNASLGDLSESCNMMVTIGPPSGLWLEMGWDGSRDLDLHMTVVSNEPRCDDDSDCRRASNGRDECNLDVCSAGFDSRGDREGDCWAANATPQWGNPLDESTNPRYLEDVRRGAGTENIKLESPTSIYRIALRSWGDEENNAYLKIFLRGDLLHHVPARRIGPDDPTGWYYFGQLQPNLGGYDFIAIDEVSEEPPRN
jgi:hypothetical protein